MPVSVIVGGQYGSEGKGKVAHWVCRTMQAAAAVRVGGPNSGHTVVNDDGRTFVLRQLPTAALLPDTVCVLPAGSYLLLPLVLNEVQLCGLSADRVRIDPFAWVIADDDIIRESQLDLVNRIASTGVGLGGAVIARAERSAHGRFAKDEPLLKPFLAETTPRLRELLSVGARVVIEGTQGFGLSLLHSGQYPYVTSRDTTAAGFLSEAGLAPMDVDDVVMVLRSFPIRVGGNSGSLPKEIDWEILSAESGRETTTVEYTTVSKKPRRVARFDAHVVRQAISVNRPTRIVLNHLDYIDSGCLDGGLSKRAHNFLEEVEHSIRQRVDAYGVSPKLICNRPSDNPNRD